MVVGLLRLRLGTHPILLLSRSETWTLTRRLEVVEGDCEWRCEQVPHLWKSHFNLTK
jgi:hypothetical protein